MLLKGVGPFSFLDLKARLKQHALGPPWGLSGRPHAGFRIWTSENTYSTTFVNKGIRKGRDV